ncbi:hypothetical protein KEM55_001384 [Ascosphaera atra]|nr:hypothetical protein KEM55_001384 [Ascosphaera atra]
MVNFLHIAAVLPLAYAQWGSQVSVDDRSLNDIYSSARRESGTLNVAAGGDAGFKGDALVNAFQQKFPDVKVNWTVDLSKYQDSRIDREYYDGDSKTDVALLSTLQDFPRWKRQGRLMSYKPPTWNYIYNSEKDSDGAYVPIQVNTLGKIYYDSSKVNSSELPSSYEQFADPKWKGRLVLTYPNDDDTVCYLFSRIVDKYGMKWFENLTQNDVQWVRGTYSPQAVIAENHNDTRDSRAITFTTTDVPSEKFIKVQQPSNDTTVSWSQTGAIFNSTNMPESAKLLLAYFTSEQFYKKTPVPHSALARRALNGTGIGGWGNSTTGGAGSRNSTFGGASATANNSTIGGGSSNSNSTTGAGAGSSNSTSAVGASSSNSTSGNSTAFAAGPLPVLENSGRSGNLFNSNATDVTHFRSWMSNRQNVEWWRFQFESLIGTPQGPSPVKVYPKSSNGTAVMHTSNTTIA